MKPEDLLDKLMEIEAEAKDGGLSIDEVISAYELRRDALNEEESDDDDGE